MNPSINQSAMETSTETLGSEEADEHEWNICTESK